jgi:hypothetical protein
MYALLVRDGREYWLTEEQVPIVAKTLKGGAKWLKLGNDYINTVDITGIANPEVMKEKTQRKRGFHKLQGGEWYSRYDTDMNWKEPYTPQENNFDAQSLGSGEPLRLDEPES